MLRDDQSTVPQGLIARRAGKALTRARGGDAETVLRSLAGSRQDRSLEVGGA
jgi:hypothetical protein